jgi:hypothetical protein
MPKRRSRSRSRSKSRKSPSSRKWITRKGKLGGKGFLSKSSSEQHKLLTKCVKKYGYRSCLGSVMVLSRNRDIQAVHGAKINKLKKWLKEKYGGQGSFGFKSPSHKHSCGCGHSKAVMGFQRSKSRKRRATMGCGMDSMCGCGCGHKEGQCTSSCGCGKVVKMGMCGMKHANMGFSRRRSPMGMCGMKHANMGFSRRKKTMVKSRKPKTKSSMGMCGMKHKRSR